MWSQPAPATDTHNTMKIVYNVLVYQLIWFLSVLGGNTGAYWGVLLLLLHLLLTPKRGADLRMMGFLLFTGLLVDGTLHQVGFITFTETGWPIPFWLMVIWLGFAITPHHSLAWLQNRPILSMLFGALGGPAAYWAGARLGASTFTWTLLPSLCTLSLIWALLLPVIMHFSVGSKMIPKALQATDK
jgi:hypothetical protein